MPEGPEIRRMVDDIDKAIGNRCAESLFFAFEHFKCFESALAGRRVTGVEARGKAVLVFFAARGDDGPWCVYSHNQLYGKWHIGTPDRAPKTNRQLRFAVIGKEKAARLYSASDIRLIRPDALAGVDYLARLGPDPLNQEVSVCDLLARFDDRRFRNRNLGGLLLDQGFVAGIGNYLRSEILFEAKIAARRRPSDLDESARKSLADAILRLVERAYRLKGVTNSPERAAALKKDGLSFSKRRHMVFARNDQRCYECGSVIAKTSIASRRLYYCPECQGTS